LREQPAKSLEITLSVRIGHQWGHPISDAYAEDQGQDENGVCQRGCSKWNGPGLADHGTVGNSYGHVPQLSEDDGPGDLEKLEDLLPE
jgi:hypothetical protein